MAKVEGKLVLPEGAKDLYGASESALNFPGPEPGFSVRWLPPRAAPGWP